jgi:hypothetical protein
VREADTECRWPIAWWGSQNRRLEVYGLPLREPALPRKFFMTPWGGGIKTKSILRRSRPGGLPVDKPLDAGFDGLPLEGARGDLRRTKALTIAERSTMTGYPDQARRRVVGCDCDGVRDVTQPLQDNPDMTCKG